MKFNNKAQNITKPYTIILILVLVAMFSGLFLKFGQELASDPENKLNDESIQYIYNRSGFSISNITSDDTTDSFYTSDIDNEGTLKDYAIEFRFYQEQSSSFRQILQDLWDLPSFMLKMMNIPIDDNWQLIINMLNLIIWTLIVYVIIRIVRGLL